MGRAGRNPEEIDADLRQLAKLEELRKHREEQEIQSRLERAHIAQPVEPAAPPKPEQIERAAFKEIMMAKLAAKQAAAKDSAPKPRAQQALPTQYGFTYFVRNGTLYKIGITENILRRMDQLKPDEILNVVRCSNHKEVERDLHRRFRDVRLPQSEYFRLNESQVNEVHVLMHELASFQEQI